MDILDIVKNIEHIEKLDKSEKVSVKVPNLIIEYLGGNRTFDFTEDPVLVTFYVSLLMVRHIENMNKKKNDEYITMLNHYNSIHILLEFARKCLSSSDETVVAAAEHTIERWNKATDFMYT